MRRCQSRNLPWGSPRLELSKNCLGKVLDKRPEVPPTSKNLLFGESSAELFGESRTFLEESGTFEGESRTSREGSRNLLGELRRWEDSVVLQRPRLVGVQGDPGLSSSGLVFAFSLMALLFHFESSAA